MIAYSDEKRRAKEYEDRNAEAIVGHCDKEGTVVVLWRKCMPERHEGGCHCTLAPNKNRAIDEEEERLYVDDTSRWIVCLQNLLSARDTKYFFLAQSVERKCPSMRACVCVVCVGVRVCVHVHMC